MDGKKSIVTKRIARRPVPVTSPISFMPREWLMTKVKKAQAVVSAPVIMPLPLFINVFSMAKAIVSPVARHSVNPDMIWIEKSIPRPRSITAII